MPEAELVLRSAYRALRGVGAAITLMHPGIDWPNAWYGEPRDADLHGRDAGRVTGAVSEATSQSHYGVAAARAWSGWDTALCVTRGVTPAGGHRERGDPSAAGCGEAPWAVAFYAGPWNRRTANPVLVIGSWGDGDLSDHSGAGGGHRPKHRAASAAVVRRCPGLTEARPRLSKPSGWAWSWRRARSRAAGGPVR
jgi:hypothetical protein